jgi:hypothetical protein
LSSCKIHENENSVVKVKVKFALEQVMTVQGECSGMTNLSLNSALNGGGCLTPSPGRPLLLLLLLLLFLLLFLLSVGPAVPRLLSCSLPRLIVLTPL